ncbi:flagellar hook-length control protein FliK [Methylomonas sp. DH-1]|uniref:flagellar hook-length control protein FliK n=1 Tax=Methylomonas sp. (strain DH-1) TaxID=1727196 RepID=UPI000B30B29C|nr:flagellar hook-length control protein FliK [Methylomonas sp. DH-1]
MNIQSSNPLSMLAASDAAAGLGAGMLGDGTNAGLFSATFLDQLAQLQQCLAMKVAGNGGELANLPQLGGLSAENLTGRNLQEFAALFGNNVPAATKLDQDIDLDDTMAALADVLQYLQNLDAAPAVAQTVAADSAAPAAGADVEAKADAAADAQTAAIVGSPLQNFTKPVETPMTQEAVLDNALKNADALGQALAVVKKNASDSGGQSRQDATSLLGKGEPSAASAADAGLAQAVSGQNAAGQGTQDNASNEPAAEPDALAPKSAAVSAEHGKGFSALAADIAQLSKSADAAAPTAAPQISRHLNHPEWNAELGEKLLWMHKQDIPSAEIRLNPEHMGPISIKIDVNQDQTSVSFTTQHAGVKEAIEAALPKLREMLSEQKLDLADVNVSQQHAEQKQGRESYQMAGDQRRSGNQDPDSNDTAATNVAAANILDEIEAGRAIASNGLLSLFA